ncbi:MAG: sialidase family protein, partial [Verrucomicrobiota bacterium]
MTIPYLHATLAAKCRRVALLVLISSTLALRAGDILTLDVCQPITAHPRHDHQLIFPLKDGRLMLVWSEYYLREKSVSNAPPSTDDAPCRISAKTSDDHGRSWGEPFVFQENTGKLNVKHPNLLRLPSGDVLFFYTEWNSRSNRAVFFRRSSDDCKNWGPPQRLSPAKGITNINNDHVLRLRSGRIVLPSFFSPSVWDANDHWQAFCYYSDDEGKNWQSSERRIDLPGRGAEEPCMVETKDGAMLAFLRTSLGSIYKARSVDGGKIWSKPTATGLPAPAAPPLLKRIPSTGNLLLIWNRNYDRGHHHQGERTPLSAAISRDDGTTWEKTKDIESVSGGSAAYAAVTFLGNEALVTYYYQTKG